MFVKWFLENFPYFFKKEQIVSDLLVFNKILNL